MEKAQKRQRNERKRKQKQQHTLQRKQRRQESPKPPSPPPAVAGRPLTSYLRPGWPPSAFRYAEPAAMQSELRKLRETLLARGARTEDEPHFLDDLVEWRRLVVEAALAYQARLREDLRVKAGDFVELEGRRFLVASTPTDDQPIIYLERTTARGSSSIPVGASGLEPYTGPLTPEELLRREALLARHREPAIRSLLGTPEAVLDEAREFVELDAAQPALTQTQRLAALARPELTILCAEDADAPAPLCEALPAATLAAARAARVAGKTMRAAAWYDWATMQTWLDAREDARMFDGGAGGDDQSLEVAGEERRREWLLASAAILTLRELALALAIARELERKGPPLRLRAHVRRAELRLSRARAQCRSAPSDRATPGLLCGPALVALGSRRERAVLATIAKLAGP